MEASNNKNCSTCNTEGNLSELIATSNHQNYFLNLKHDPYYSLGKHIYSLKTIGN